MFAVALRNKALYLADADSSAPGGYTDAVAAFLTSMRGLGYTVDEPLLRALERTPAEDLRRMADEAAHIVRADADWTPLVKGWDTPTGEGFADHLATAYANILPEGSRGAGVELPCGHFIPEGTFPMERYNGCPFCGRVFEHSGKVLSGGGEATVLSLWTDRELLELEKKLLASAVPLDATGADNLRILIEHYGTDSTMPVPTIKETAMLCIDALTGSGRAGEALRYISSPADILRYLWYKKTGKAFIMRPADIVARAVANTGYRWREDYDSRSENAADEAKAGLRLKYGRKMCRVVADWLEAMPMPVAQMCESMHPYRGMWVRAIRALRLAEYSQRSGYPRLRELTDRFYRSDYDVWAGELERDMLEGKADTALERLKERPGVFSRSLLATMLRLGPEKTLEAFAAISDRVPMRLLVTLASYAGIYFDPLNKRAVRLPDGRTVTVDANARTRDYTPGQLEAMAESVRKMALDTAAARFAGQRSEARSVYIDPALYDIPLPVGDRSQTVHDKGGAMQGQRFAVEGDKVRLFMEWGRGLAAAHIDMDLSCKIIYDDHSEDCAYYSLTVEGATHSGDIQYIPDYTGAAEYIELDLTALRRAGAKYAAFICNAYTDGSLSPNMCVGWMDSRHPMKVDNDTGVAYDPSTVVKAISIAGSNLAKGLLFGVLDVAAGEIIWLEMPYTGQTAAMLYIEPIKTLLARLAAKISFGELLAVRARAQHQAIAESAEDADDVYTAESALDPSVATSLLG